MMARIWTAWHNGSRGYGFSVDVADFDPSWTDVTVELPGRDGPTLVTANVAKQSFTQKCPHLIDKRIGRWMREEGYSPWPSERPPRFNVEPLGNGHFRVLALAAR